MKNFIEKSIIILMIIMMVISTIQLSVINDRLNNMEDVIDKLDKRIVEVQNRLESINSEIDEINRKIEENEEIINKLETNLNTLEKSVNEIEKVNLEKTNVEVKETRVIDNISYIKNIYSLNDKNVKEVTFHLSFYTNLACENGGWANLTASGKKLTDGMVANNHLPFGTKIYIEGYGLKTVEDRGSSKYFDDETKVDVFVPRLDGETDSQYHKRVNNMGRKTVKGYIFM